jgi:preprotein translocase subunit YajC
MPIPAALALAAASPSQGSSQPPGNFLLIIAPYAAIFAVFYFLLIRPARQRQKDQAAMLDTLKPGDKVVCAGGIHGTVVGVADGVVQIRISDQVRIDVDKASVTVVKRPSD